MPSKITKRGQMKWRASVMVNGITKQKLYPDATKQSYRQAVIWEQEIKEQLKKTEIDMDCWKIVDWANEYLDDIEKRFCKKTLLEKKSAFSRLVNYLNKDMRVNELTPRLALPFLRQQLKNRSGYAANKDRKNLSAAWNWGCKYLDHFPREMINPFSAVDKFPEIRKPRYVPPEDDFWSIYKIAEEQDQIMLLTFLHTAGRRSEIFNLCWEDLDWGNNQIRLWTSKREGGNKESDWLPMTSELRQALLNWWEKRPVKETKHVFVCIGGNLLDEKYYGKPFITRKSFMKRLCKKAGVKHFGFHSIRHLTATILYHKGYNVSVIQSILRHKSPTTTNRYLRTLGLKDTKTALEEGLKRPAEIIPFTQQKVGLESI